MTTPTMPTAGDREGLTSQAEAGSPEPAVARWRRGDAWMLLVVVLAGSLLRLVAALVSRGWESAPDQLAWGLLLEEWIALAPTAMTIAAACHRPRWWRGWLTWAAATTACLVPLALAQAVLDNGFGLESLSLFRSAISSSRCRTFRSSPDASATCW